MKKLIMTAMIVCAAVVANAATAAWGVGYISEASDAGGWGSTLLGTSSTGYTAVLNIYSDAGLSTLVTSSSSSLWDDGFAEGETEDVLVNATETTYYGQVIVSHGSQSLTSQSFQFTTSSLTEQAELYVMTDPDEVSGLAAIGGGDFSGDHGAFAASGWTAAPEPTSGLLMLVGLAGLALRRRRA